MLIESLSLDFDYWLMRVPVDVSSAYRDLSTGEATEGREAVNLNFTILAFGLTYFFEGER